MVRFKRSPRRVRQKGRRRIRSAASARNESTVRATIATGILDVCGLTSIRLPTHSAKDPGADRGRIRAKPHADDSHMAVTTEKWTDGDGMKKVVRYPPAHTNSL